MTFDIRMRHNLISSNPILEQIKQEYSIAYHIAVSACGVLQEEYRSPIQDEEIGYFAILFVLAFQRLSKPSRKNVLVVCISGHATSKLFMYRFQTAFAPYVEHIYTCTAFHLSAFDFAGLNIDCVFTTVPLHLKLPVPVFEVSLLLDDREIEKYRHILQGEDVRFLRSFFREDVFCEKICTENKEEALASMCLVVADTIPLPQDFLASVLRREQISRRILVTLWRFPIPAV